MGISNGISKVQRMWQAIHCHVHVIPRRKGDVKNPRGGVRHVIAGK
jgi:ATP adenylyltransferase